jgi:hypothetical protein
MKGHVTFLAFGALAAMVTVGAAGAEEKSSRYSMSPADGGFVRLDTHTGEMAFCKRGADGGWACEPMPESQQATREELDRLRRENEELKNRQAGISPPSGAPPPDGRDLAPPSREGKIPVPTEQDVDKLFDYLEGMAKKLKERLKRLEEQEGGKGTPL